MMLNHVPYLAAFVHGQAAGTGPITRSNASNRGSA